MMLRNRMYFSFYFCKDVLLTENIIGVRHLQTADLQTCRLADLQTCRLADLQTFVTSANHVTLDNNIVTRS